MFDQSPSAGLLAEYEPGKDLNLRVTNWFGGNIGANGEGFWSTFSITAYGSDGSVIHFNGVMQFHLSNGEVHVDFTLGNCRG